MTRVSRVPQPTLDLTRRSLFGAVLGIGALATLQACGGDAEGGFRRGRGRHRQVGLADADHVGPGHLLGRLRRADARADVLGAHLHRQPGQRAAEPGRVVGVRQGRHVRLVHPPGGAGLQRRQPDRRGGGQEEPRAGPRRRQLADRRAAGGPDRRDDRRPRVHPRARPPRTTSTPSSSPARPAWSSTRPSSSRDPDSLATQPAGLGPVRPRLVRPELQGGAAQERQVLRGRRHHDHELRALPGGGRGHRGRVAAVGPVQRGPAARQPARGGQGRRPRGAGDALALRRRRST